MQSNSMSLVPTIIEATAHGERGYDIFSRLLRDRIVFLNGEVNDASAAVIVAQLIFLENEDPKKDIWFYINSPGGDITAGFAIYDTMKYIKPAVSTLCLGQACSMGAFLLSGGAKGKRFSLPNSSIMIHQPLGGFQGQATDIEIRAKHILRLKSRLNTLLAAHTGRDLSAIETACERDNFLTPEEALAFGLVDKIVETREG